MDILIKPRESCPPRRYRTNNDSSIYASRYKTGFGPNNCSLDHLIQARVGSDSDTKAAIYENNEVYQFLESASRKYGIGFWKPGAGIIHQVVLENYAFPGG